VLKSLEAAEKPESFPVEVLVVNNSSSDQTHDYLAREASKAHWFAFTALDEARRGKANAVNRALRSSQGQIMLVFDDDVVVHPRCLISHLECHAKSSFDAVQGRVLPGSDPSGNAANSEHLAEYNIPLIDYGESERAIRGFIGTNVSFTRKVFETVGFFDGRLGPGAAGFSEDTEYSIRLRRAGFRIGYAPSAVVYHELNPGRYGKSYNRAVEYRKGVSRSLYRRDSLLFNVFPNLLANAFRYVLYVALRKSQKAYNTEGRIAKQLGYLMGRFGRQRRESD
jgi:GT2 family glycosyltransferase